MLKKSGYLILGSSSFALGVVGIFLPLLPTTCFIILSAWAFSKSSDQLYQKLMSHAVFGSMLLNWRQHKSIPAGVKLVAISSVICSGGLSIYLLQGQQVLQVFTVVILLSVSGYLLHLPTAQLDTEN